MPVTSGQKIKRFEDESTKNTPFQKVTIHKYRFVSNQPFTVELFIKLQL